MLRSWLRAQGRAYHEPGHGEFVDIDERNYRVPRSCVKLRNPATKERSPEHWAALWERQLEISDVMQKAIDHCEACMWEPDQEPDE